jgi:hypothetical protein
MICCAMMCAVLCCTVLCKHRGYRPNPYHNSTHAADVTRSVHFFLNRCGMRGYMTDVETLAAVFAAVIHDYDHPGRTNACTCR